MNILAEFSTKPNSAHFILSRSIIIKKLIKKHEDKIRFSIVGGINTAIDFVILFILVSIGLPTIVSNIISTSSALVFSFFANKKFTFKNNSSKTKTQFIYFLIITLFGLWAIQPIIIELTRSVLELVIKNNYLLILLIGKIIATCVTLVWNYLLYRKYVFTDYAKDIQIK